MSPAETAWISEIPADQTSLPCRHYIGAEQRHCGRVPTREFMAGRRCIRHTPAALAGKPEPSLLTPTNEVPF